MSDKMTVIDVENWKRKDHFKFFSKMANPSFGFTTEVDCTIAYDFAKQHNLSFYAYYLHCSMKAVNAVDALKLRLLNGEVVQYDTIDAGCTISRPDETFGFAHIPFSETFEEFDASLKQEIEEVQNCSGLRINNDDLQPNHIRHSTLPWFTFSCILHPTNLDPTDSIPKIVFGKFKIVDGRKLMPIAIEAHHGLADGFHLCQYVEKFQNILNTNSSL